MKQNELARTLEEHMKNIRRPTRMVHNLCVCDKVAVTVEDLSRAVSGIKETVAITGSAVNSVDQVKDSTAQSFTALVTVVAKGNETSVRNSEVRLTFLESRYMLGRYVPTLKDMDLEKDASEN